MNHHHPSFSFAGVIPVEVTVAPVEELRKALAEHEANCPGTYQECCTDGRGNLKTGPLEKLYRKWASKKCDLKARLELAERMAEHPSPTTVKPAPKAKAKPSGNPNMVEKTVPELIEAYMVTHQRLVDGGMDNPDWHTIRQNLYNQRKRIQGRCRRAGVPFPASIPDIPSKPKAGRCTRKPGIPEHLLSRAERKRRSAA